MKKETYIKRMENAFCILACIVFVVSLVCTYYFGAVAMLIGVPVMVACIMMTEKIPYKLADRKYDNN